MAYTRQTYKRRPYPQAEPEFNLKYPEKPDPKSPRYWQDQKIYNQQVTDYKKAEGLHNQKHGEWSQKNEAWENEENTREEAHNKAEEDRYQSDPDTRKSIVDALRAEQGRQAQEQYNQSWKSGLGSAGKFLAIPSGGAMGAAEARGMGNALWALTRTQSAVASPELRLLSMLGPGMLGLKSFDWSRAAEERAKDQNASPLDRDLSQASANMLEAQGYGNLGMGLAVGGRGALQPNAIPPGPVSGPIANFLRIAPTSWASQGQQGSQGGGGPTPIDLKGMSPTEASEAILGKLGIAPGKNLAENRTLIEQGLKRASPDVARDIAASHPSFNQADLAGSVTQRLKYMRALSIPLALGGIGAAALSPDEAEASVTGRLPQETNSLNPVPSRGEQVMNALSRTASAVPRAAAETAPYLVPGLSQAMTARDMATTGDALYTPSRQYLDEAAHMQPGRIGREVDRAGLASNLQAAQAENARQVAEMRARQAAAGPRQFPQNQPIDPGSVPDSLRRFVDPSSALPQQNALAPQGGAPQQPNALNPQQQTQAPSPIQRPQSIPAEPQEAEAPPRPTPKVPDDYTPGPLQRKQEKMIENALRQKEQERMMQNELALQGPDGNFYRALQAFQQHFAGAGAAAAGAR